MRVGRNEEIKKKYREYIEKESLLKPTDKVVIGVSGGRDSVVLTDMLYEWFANQKPIEEIEKLDKERSLLPAEHLRIVHCNFHLRAGECERDEAFVEQLAERYHLPYSIVHFETERYAHDHHLSIEEAARELRYEYFEEERQRHHYTLIATAHHLDDSIETFFINLMRGTGIAGLRGIRPKHERIIRPLLCFTREEINEYVTLNGLSYVDDSTNFEPLYLRNRIRQQLIPEFVSLNLGFRDKMERTMEHLRDVELIYQEAIERGRMACVRETGEGIVVLLEELEQSRTPQTLLFEILRLYNFTPVVVAKLYDSTKHNTGRRFFSATHCATIDRGQIYVYPITKEEHRSIEIAPDCRQTDGVIRITFEKRAREEIETLRVDRNQALFDYDRLSFPLRLRPRRAGDRIRPYGMRGTKLVSDIIKDQKIDPIEKAKLWLLCDKEDRILWIVGVRQSAHCAVGAETKQVWQLTVEEE